jgi:hypothetical protein
MNTLQKRLVAFVLAVSAAALPLAVACSNSAEGERCDVLSSNGGNDDCQDGLVCTSKTDLNGASSDLCCPPDRTTSTTPQCQVAHAPVGGDAGIPTDSGSTPDTGATEASVDSGRDAGIDSASSDASDAGSDASDASDASAAIDGDAGGG